MNLKENKYSQYALVQEMMDTVETVKKFDPACTREIAAKVAKAGKAYFTGEGSSRIFPAKNALRKTKRWGLDLNAQTDGSWQSREYDLSKFAVFLASNSGRTKEVTLLAKKLKEEGNALRFGLTANQDTILSTFCAETHVLNCGWEQAVAATKSVVEQALYYESVLWNMAGKDVKAGLAALPAQIEQALTLQVPAEIVDWVKKAETIYFAGYNDGVAEELTLKTNEITRRKSDFLEGTYALHGIEEVMKEIAADWQETFNDEFKLIEPQGVEVTVEDVETPKKEVPVEIQDNLVDAIFACHDGVIRFIPAYPSVVETSSNLAIINIGEGKASIKILARSSREDMKDYVVTMLESCFSMAGMKVETAGSYGGWDPNPDSEILHLLLKEYKELFGQDGIIQVDHAGLECSVILGKYPWLDVVSLGPTMKSPHTTTERALIETVAPFWQLLKKTLEDVPEKK